MQRRAFLTAAGACGAAALAGCLGESVAPASGSTHPTLSVETDPTPDDVSVTVSVLRGFDAEGPARLRIALTNEGSDDLSAIFGTVPPFTDLHGEQVGGNAQLLLVPTDHQRKQRVIPDTPIEGTWRATGDVATNATAIMTDVPPDETMSQTYDLLAGPDTEGLPAGEYRFEERDYLGIETWGFTVSVAD
jgi:hypothetical protein